MTSDKLSSLTRSVPVLSLLFVAAILFAGPLATATTTATTEEQKIIQTQDIATQQLSESDRDVNGIEFTPRWGAASTIEPNNTPSVLFAECLEDEFAVSSMYIFETSDIVASQSFPFALPDDTMVWITVVTNTDTNNARAASIGVICADENDGGEDVNLDVTTKTTIQNTVKNIIKVQNNQIINLGDVVNVYQQITQNAIQILSVTGNNNTVNQVISQSAAQIASQNATTPAQVDQIINQNAQQEGVITGGGNLLNQTIDQDAGQAANVTGGGSSVDQAIDQDAGQAANVTGGGNILDQFIDQNASQAANVTDGEEE
jgi:dihydrofolate reductase